MSIQHLKKGEYFYLHEMGETYPYIALEDCKKTVTDAGSYWKVLSENRLSGITIPLSVSVGYENYLKISTEPPLKCNIKVVWDNECR